jgi:acetolactate synthase-1/2/3 large subunit
LPTGLWQPEWPVLLPQYVGRVASGLTDMVALAEATGAAVSDVQSRRISRPSIARCRMNKDIFKTADLILALDCRDWEAPDATTTDRINRTLRAYYPDHCQWADIGFADIEISKWAKGYQKFRNARPRGWPTRTRHSGADRSRARTRRERTQRPPNAFRDRKFAISDIHDKRRSKWR